MTIENAYIEKEILGTMEIVVFTLKYDSYLWSTVVNVQLKKTHYVGYYILQLIVSYDTWHFIGIE